MAILLALPTTKDIALQSYIYRKQNNRQPAFTKHTGEIDAKTHKNSRYPWARYR